jgi:arylsulfatase
VHHVGRWSKGGAEGAKYVNCAIQNSRYTLVNNRELYDLKTDPGEIKNVVAEHPQVLAQLRAAYDKWWEETKPLMVNEATVMPREQPFTELYIKQFGAEAAKAAKEARRAAKSDGDAGKDSRAKLRKLREERRKRAETGGNQGTGQE